MLYWAYGSNLNIEAMERRCPRAKVVGSLILNDARLVFRSVADVEYAEGESCPGGLWEITRACEAELDIYEGVEGGLYRKSYITVEMQRTGRIRRCLVYQMNRSGIMPPNDWYLQMISRGYDDFGLDQAYLDAALQRSWSDKTPTKYLRRKSLSRGGALARIDHSSLQRPARSAHDELSVEA